MTKVLSKYIPQAAVEASFALIKANNVHLKIVNERVTRHGDYRKMANGQHQITVNASLNKYRFFITLIHEIAHLVAFQKYGRAIKPHGKEWKFTFQQLMLPFIRPEIFPSQLLPLLAMHFKNPRASSDTDARLSLALKQFDPENDKNYIFEIPANGLFRLYNGKIFKRGNKRVKRYECLEVATGRVYLFNPNAEVEFLKTEA
ncbi:metallopeptidase [Patiriisocius marinistellae]|uniref:Metallopeptidase n=1 Tax=Patiriisocius marinistellae TaxID=2494560 RepID=A0A5J4FWJ7_9FLAO|nr:SprT-like domain-containing protein [Patiriisocius marinistellae]GEQ85574.1 metallopeptidase [Patiriisocius marinistellae]